MAASPNVQVKVKWAPYFLSPPSVWKDFGEDAAVKGVDKMEFYEAKFGKGRIEQFAPRLAKAFEEAGCGKYSLAGRTGPTMDAHRLMALAGKHDLQNELAEELFKNYFCEGKTICDKTMLAESASKVGIPDAASYLVDTEAGKPQVMEELMLANGVSGVPHFIIEGDGTKETLSGAQPVEAFLQVFKKMGR